jgi:predicted proteasome-type protease
MLAMNEKNETICINAWTPWSLKARTEQLVDFILGDAFLRNVYILYNYGNWTSANNEAPYVQLLSVSIIVRLGLGTL